MTDADVTKLLIVSHSSWDLTEGQINASHFNLHKVPQKDLILGQHHGHGSDVPSVLLYLSQTLQIF